MSLYLVISALVVVAALAVWLWLKNRRDGAALAVPAKVRPSIEALKLATDSTPPAPLDSPKGALTPREAREVFLKERRELGVCRYCDETAQAGWPSFVPVKATFEGARRFLNATSNTRWTIDLGRDAEHKELCHKHHEQVMGYFDAQVAKERKEYAHFANEKRLEMFEFERHVADEVIVEEMQTLRRGRSKKKAPAPKADNVVKMPVKKATGTGE